MPVLIAVIALAAVAGAFARTGGASTTYAWKVTHAEGLLGLAKGSAPIRVRSLTGSGTVVVGPAGAVARATGTVHLAFLLSANGFSTQGRIRSIELKVSNRGARVESTPGGPIMLSLSIATSSRVADCVAAPTGVLVLSDSPALGTSFDLLGVCGLEATASANANALRLTIARR